MSDFNPNEFLTGVGDDTEGDSDLVRLLRSKVKEAARVAKQLHDQVNDYTAKEARQVLDKTWQELGVPESVRKFYQGEANPEAVKAWFAENKDVFNLASPDLNGKPPAPQAQEPTPQQQELQSFQDAANLGVDNNPLGGDAWNAQAAELKGKGANANEADLDRLLASAFGNAGLQTPVIQ